MSGVEQARELLPGAFYVPLPTFSDFRGSFVKTYAVSAMRSIGINFSFAEEFYSASRENVIRGMHFQVPPFAHDKIVYCPSGAALDVLVDLRRGEHYGRVATVLLDRASPGFVFVPPGVAHGFRALADETIMIYKTSTEYSPPHDRGIHYASFGFDWGVVEPTVSARDRTHPALSEFVSPFG